MFYWMLVWENTEELSKHKVVINGPFRRHMENPRRCTAFKDYYNMAPTQKEENIGCNESQRLTRRSQLATFLK